MVNSESKLWAFIAYLLGVVGFILVLLLKRKNKFAMYHAKQSLTLFLAGVVINIAGMAPIVGWFIIRPIGMLFIFVLWILGLVNSATGKHRRLPVIGELGEKIEL